MPLIITAVGFNRTVNRHFVGGRHKDRAATGGTGMRNAIPTTPRSAYQW